MTRKTFIPDAENATGMSPSVVREFALQMEKDHEDFRNAYVEALLEQRRKTARQRKAFTESLVCTARRDWCQRKKTKKEWRHFQKKHPNLLEYVNWPTEKVNEEWSTFFDHNLFILVQNQNAEDFHKPPFYGGIVLYPKGTEGFLIIPCCGSAESTQSWRFLDQQGKPCFVRAYQLLGQGYNVGEKIHIEIWSSQGVTTFTISCLDDGKGEIKSTFLFKYIDHKKPWRVDGHTCIYESEFWMQEALKSAS